MAQTKNPIKSCAVTALEVEKGILSAGFNLSELISFIMHCNARNLSKDTDGNVDFPSRVSKRFGLQSWMTIKKTEVSAQHEFLKPIYLCVHRGIVLIYLHVHQKC